MPANLTPEYYKAEQWYRTAVTSDEKILALEEMLRVMPKHKGTDHLRADLRRKLSKLRESGAQKGGTKHVDVFHIPRTGAGQIALLGTPNSGKSSILAMLTNAKVNAADFPFATSAPVPGMVEYEDVQIQLIDTPPITAEYIAPGQVGTYRNCDVVAVVIDLSEEVEEQFRICFEFLESRRLLIGGRTSATDEQGNVLGRRAFCLGTKADIKKANSTEKLERLCDGCFEVFETCIYNEGSLERLRQRFFEELRVVRIYSKPPGKKADLEEPFTLPAGSSVMDLANSIHRELAEKFKSARIWGTGVYDGQNVQRNHILHDKDVVELHFS